MIDLLWGICGGEIFGFFGVCLCMFIFVLGVKGILFLVLVMYYLIVLCGMIILCSIKFLVVIRYCVFVMVVGEWDWLGVI